MESKIDCWQELDSRFQDGLMRLSITCTDLSSQPGPPKAAMSSADKPALNLCYLQFKQSSKATSAIDWQVSVGINHICSDSFFSPALPKTVFYDFLVRSLSRGTPLKSQGWAVLHNTFHLFSSPAGNMHTQLSHAHSINLLWVRDSILTTRWSKKTCGQACICSTQ